MQLISLESAEPLGFLGDRRLLTFRWREEVEEGVVGDRLGDRPHRATALVLLLLLDGLQRYVLPLGPVDHTAEEQGTPGSTSDFLIWFDQVRVKESVSTQTARLSRHRLCLSVSPFISVPVSKFLPIPTLLDP